MPALVEYSKGDRLHPNSLLSFAFNIPAVSKIRKGVFRCACGSYVTSSISHVKGGHTKSCGCLRIKSARVLKTIHGMNGSPEHKAWTGIIDRCTNPKSDAYPNYGGRGIQICEAWLNSFSAFYADMGARPDNHQIDRIDNDGNYEPDNCRWVTSKVNNQNSRRSKWWYVDGIRYNSALEAAETLGVCERTIFSWCNGGTKENCRSELKYRRDTNDS